MITTAYYLLGCVFCIYNFAPKTKSTLLKYSIVIPLLFTAFSFVSSLHEIIEGTTGIYGHSFAYGVGKWTRTIILPLIISIPFLYFFFKKKIANNNKTEFSSIFISLIIIGLLFTVGQYQKDLEIENYKNFEKVLENEYAIEEIKSSIKIMEKKLPITTPDGFIIYGIEFNEKEKKVDYLYKNPTTAVEDLDSNVILEYKNSWREELIRISKNNPKNTSFITADISMVFKLEDINGKPILEIKISPNEMK
jgi:hypothetical protein